MHITIDNHHIGTGHAPYVIAELSANHNGSLEKALATISAAKRAGADAIKLQTYTPDTMTIDCDRPDFMVDGDLWGGQTLFGLYQSAYTPFEWHKALFEHARRENITCFSTPFDESAVDLLEELDTPAYKIASFEMIDLPLLRYIARTGKPVIMSTGMASLTEVEEAVATLRDAGCHQLVVLHCISGYPTPVAEANLLTIPDLSSRLQLPIGLSDHTMGTAVSVAAVALGACVIEKHFILDRNDTGPDSSFSIEPAELAQLCLDAKAAWQSLGSAGYQLKEVEEFGIKYRRSLYFVEDMQAGDTINKQNMRRIRPGFGLPPKHYEELLGKKIASDVKRGTAVSWELIADE